MELTDTRTAWLGETATALHGYARRRFLARPVQDLGRGGQRRAERARGWNRQTLRTAIRALARGLPCLDAIALRRRKRVEAHLPTLLDASTAIVDRHSQTDPPLRPHRLSTRLPAAAVRRHLSTQHGYPDDKVPPVRTIAPTVRAVGEHPTTVAKPHPHKRFPSPLPAVSTELGSIKLQTPRRIRYAVRSLPQRSSPWDQVRVGATTGGQPKPPLTTFNRPRP